MTFHTLNFSIILFRKCKYFSLLLSICQESFWDLMFSFKKLNFTGINYYPPVLYQLLVYLISRFFQNLAKVKSACVCVCVCVCARVCICVCKCIYVYKCDINRSNVTVVTCATQYCAFIFKMWRNFKSSQTENLKIFSLIQVSSFYLLEILLHFLKIL